VRLGPGSKLVVLLAFNIMALTFDRLENLLILTMASLAGYVMSRPNASRLKLTALMLAPPVWGITFSQAMFYQEWPRTVMLVLIPPSAPLIGWLTGGVYLYYQGFAYGLKQSLRLVSVMLLGLSIAWTTGESQLLRALRGVLKNARVSLSISVAARFLNTVLSEAKSAYTSFTLSGFKLTRPREAIRLLMPLVAQVVRRTYTVVLTLYSRAFNPSQPPSGGQARLSPGLVASLALLSFASALGLLKLLTVLFLADALYLPQLKPVYRWVMDNL